MFYFSECADERFLLCDFVDVDMGSVARPSPNSSKFDLFLTIFTVVTGVTKPNAFSFPKIGKNQRLASIYTLRVELQ